MKRQQLMVCPLAILALLAAAPLPAAAQDALPAEPPATAAPAPERDKARAACRAALDALLLDGDRAKARAGFQAALALDPTYRPPRFNLGLMLGQDGYFDEAAADFQTIKTQDPTGPDGARADQALASLARLRTAAPATLYEDHLRAAEAFYLEGQSRAALSETALAAGLDAARPEAYVLGARVLAKQGLWQDAADLLGKAVARTAAADRAPLLALLDACHGHAQDAPAAAVPDAKAPENPEQSQYIALTVAGGEALKSKNYALAADKFAQAAALYPGRPAAQVRAATALALVGDTDQARQIAATVGDRDPAASGAANTLLAALTATQNVGQETAADVPPPGPAAPRLAVAHAPAAKPFTLAMLAGVAPNPAMDPNLLYYAGQGDLPKVKSLLLQGASLGSRQKDGTTALMAAAAHNRLAAVRLLLGLHADVNATNTIDDTALMVAAAKGATDVIPALLAAGASPDLKNGSGMTALMLAVQARQAEAVSALVQAHADVQAQDEWGNTALMLAAADGQDAVVKTLLDAQAKVNVRNSPGKTALSLAVAKGRDSTAALLREAGGRE